MPSPASAGTPAPVDRGRCRSPWRWPSVKPPQRGRWKKASEPGGPQSGRAVAFPSQMAQSGRVYPRPFAALQDGRNNVIIRKTLETFHAQQRSRAGAWPSPQLRCLQATLTGSPPRSRSPLTISSRDHEKFAGGAWRPGPLPCRDFQGTCADPKKNSNARCRPQQPDKPLGPAKPRQIGLRQTEPIELCARRILSSSGRRTGRGFERGKPRSTHGHGQAMRCWGAASPNHGCI